MVSIWSLSQHVGRKALTVKAETTRRLLEHFLVICHNCHATRQLYCDTGVLGRLDGREAILTAAGTGKISKDLLWRQYVTSFATHSDRTLQHKHGTSFTKHTDQHKNSAWKIFSAENRYLYKSLKRNEKYQNYFISILEEKTLNDFHEKMIATDKRYNMFDYHFTNFCTSANVSVIKTKFDPYDTQLAKSNGIFSRLISDLDTNEILFIVRRYHEMINNFDNENIDSAFRVLLHSVTQELSKRISSMTPEDIFRVADMLYVTGFHRHNMVIKAVIQRCVSNPDILDVPEQRILFFFYLGLERVSRRGVTVEMQDQDEMAAVIESCNINEIGVMTLGLFRAEIQLKSERLGLLVVKKLEENLDTCHPITLSAILKFIQYTTDRRLSEKFPAINEALTDRTFVSKVAKAVPRATVKDTPWVMRICRLYSSIRFCPEEVFQAVVRKVLENGSSHVRLKDIAELLMRFSNFAYSGKDTQKFYNVLKDELHHRKTSEFENYIVNLAMSILAFIQMGVYPLPLIEMLFSEEKLTKFDDKKFYFSRLPYVISESVKLERPDYGGPLLPAKYSDQACEQHWYLQEVEHAHIKSQMRDPTMRAQFTSALEEALESYLGDRKYFKTHMFLHHFFSSDIGLAVNERGNVIPVKDWFTHAGQLKQETCTRIVIVPLLERDALYTFMDREGDRSQHMVSKILMKFRQLKLHGFNVVHIFQNEFIECHNKQDLLGDKLSPFMRKAVSASTGKAVGKL